MNTKLKKWTFYSKLFRKKAKKSIFRFFVEKFLVYSARQKGSVWRSLWMKMDETFWNSQLRVLVSSTNKTWKNESWKVRKFCERSWAIKSAILVCVLRHLAESPCKISGFNVQDELVRILRNILLFVWWKLVHSLLSYGNFNLRKAFWISC